MGQNENLRASATASLIEQSGELSFRKPAFLRNDQDLLGNLNGGLEDNDANERQWVESLVALERAFLDHWRISGGFSFGYAVIDEHAYRDAGQPNFQPLRLPLT